MAFSNILVGRRIKNRLDELNKKQADFAKELNVSEQMINKIINGRKAVTIEELRKIAYLLDINLEKLVKLFTTEKDKDPIDDFVKDVNSQEAKDGLKKAKKFMDLIIFHRDLKKAHQDLLTDK
ncbi:MAG: helix-turn-helix domain-containing protein [Halanaerobiales bacterium]